MDISITRGDVVWVNLPPLPDSCVKHGMRPAVVIQNDIGNEHSTTTIIVPVTTTIKKLGMPTHVLFKADFFYRESMAQCEQLITIDKSQIVSVAGHLPKSVMQAIDLGIIRSVLS